MSTAKHARGKLFFNWKGRGGGHIFSLFYDYLRGLRKSTSKFDRKFGQNSICFQNNLNLGFFPNILSKIRKIIFLPTSLFIANKWSECLETINFFGTEKNLFSREIFFWQFQTPSHRQSIDPVSRQQQPWYQIGFYHPKKVHLKYKNRHKHDRVMLKFSYKDPKFVAFW